MRRGWTEAEGGIRARTDDGLLEGCISMRAPGGLVDGAGRATPVGEVAPVPRG